MLSYLVRGADIGRNARFVNQKSGGGPERTRPTVAVTSFVAADEALVDWRLATEPDPRLHRRACPDLDDLRRAFPGN